MSENNDLDTKSLLLELLHKIDMLLPAKVSLSHISDVTGVSRQSIREYLINHHEPEVDFWKNGGKIFVARNTAVKIIGRYNAKR